MFGCLGEGLLLLAAPRIEERQRAWTRKQTRPPTKSPCEPGHFAAIQLCLSTSNPTTYLKSSTWFQSHTP